MGECESRERLVSGGLARGCQACAVSVRDIRVENARAAQPSIRFLVAYLEQMKP